MLSQAELETEESGLATIFGLPPTPPQGPNEPNPENQISTLDYFFCYHVYCTHLCILLHQIVGDMCTVPVPSLELECIWNLVE